jgi:hypothetical protein
MPQVRFWCLGIGGRFTTALGAWKAPILGGAAEVERV